MKYSKLSFDFGAKFEFFSNKKILEIHHFRGFIYWFSLCSGFERGHINIRNRKYLKKSKIQNNDNVVWKQDFVIIFIMIRIYIIGFERGHIIIRNYPGWKPFKRCSGHRPLPFNWRIFPGFVTKRRWNWTQSLIFGRFAIFYRFYWISCLR